MCSVMKVSILHMLSLWTCRERSSPLPSCRIMMWRMMRSCVLHWLISFWGIIPIIHSTLLLIIISARNRDVRQKYFSGDALFCVLLYSKDCGGVERVFSFSS